MKAKIHSKHSYRVAHVPQCRDWDHWVDPSVEAEWTVTARLLRFLALEKRGDILEVLKNIRDWVLGVMCSTESQ